MLLSTLLSSLPNVALTGLRDVEIAGIAYDSRELAHGELFVALPGVHADGHQFITSAVERGAVAVVCREAPGELTVPYAVVPDPRAAMADLAATLYGYPSRRIKVIGVTGTDGKTTTCTLLHAMLQATGHAAGLIGTVSFRVGDREWDNSSRQTTPESPDVQRLLAAMVEARLEYAVVEATSHGLVLDRLRGCDFDVGIFTNLTSDHLDFHGTTEHYRAAKARLFVDLGHLSKPGVTPVAILNCDDPSYDFMRLACTVPVLSYGLSETADVRARDVEVTATGISFRAVTSAGETAVRSTLAGRFNVYNVLASLAFAISQGIQPAVAAAALGAVDGVPGRMRRVEAGQPFSLIIDYAHTPDSLAKVLDDLRCVTGGRLIAVFGAAGERDRAKRPVMGRLAAERCDLVILTDEDPRLEDREAIIEEIAAGARSAGARDGRELLLRPDRREAIRLAVQAAQPGDLILLAGKGHERCIISGTERIPWDEEFEARAAIAVAAGAEA